MAEPLTLSEAKAQLRKTDTSEDGLITSYIVAAREWVENYTGHVLVSREFEQRFDAWNKYLTLYHQPVSALDDITYTDIDGAEVAYEDGILWTVRYPARIYPPVGSVFPALGSNPTIIVSYTAGYDDAEEVPQALKQAMLLLIGHWFSNRSGVSVGASAADMPLAVLSLCKPFRGAVMA